MSVKAVTRFTAAIALASAAIAGTASAQGWQSVPGSYSNNAVGSGPARPFFDNLSYDGAGCNVGFILSNTAANANCANQKPASWLPFLGTNPTTFYGNGNNASNFMFSGGTYMIDVIYQSGKTLGGLNTAPESWGIFNGAPGSDVQLGGVGALPYTFSTASSWGFFMDLVDLVGTRTYSSSSAQARQFALFGFGNSSATTGGGLVSPVSGSIQTFYVGLEDQGCTSGTQQGCTIGSDFDNNDVVLRIRAIPEPSTYILMASGLLGLAVVARRRRTV